MPVTPLITQELSSALDLQGISSEAFVGVLQCDDAVPVLEELAGKEAVLSLDSVDDAVKRVRGNGHWVLVTSSEKARELLRALGPEGANSVAVIAVGTGEQNNHSHGALRSLGLMAASSLAKEELGGFVKRGLEYRALRALELAHRCEARRLARREMDLLGYPPETMTDDLNTCQPPPLPVGPISTYNLEASSEAFERAYIDRVQLLCESAREAAKYLDVSAATLARRLRRDSANEG